MNKRQRKKIARKNNDWYKGIELRKWNCPICGWDSLRDEELKYGKTLWFEKDYWSINRWEFEFTCPYCKTKFSYEDSE